MEYNEIRVGDIPCLEFLVDSDAYLYVGPRLSWWERRRLRTVHTGHEVIYLYEVLDRITRRQLSYNFPGVAFPKGFSAETIFDSVRESVKEEVGIVLDPSSKFFVRYDGDEFVLFESAEKLDLVVPEKKCKRKRKLLNVFWNSSSRAMLDEMADESYEESLLESTASAVSQEADDVKKAIEKLLLTGFPVEVIKSWLEQGVKLSRLRITRQFKILLVDYDKEIKMGPLPKTIFLFYLCHPEGVKFSYLQDYVDELRHIYGRLCRNDDPEKMERSIASLVEPFNNSISEKVTAVKNAFLKQISEEITKHYCIRGAQGEKKGIALDRSLVEWECEL